MPNRSVRSALHVDHPAYSCFHLMVSLTYNSLFCSMGHNCFLYPKHRIYSIFIPLRMCQKCAKNHKSITEVIVNRLWHVSGTFLACCGMAVGPRYAKLNEWSARTL